MYYMYIFIATTMYTGILFRKMMFTMPYYSCNFHVISYIVLYAMLRASGGDAGLLRQVYRCFCVNKRPIYDSHVTYFTVITNYYSSKR